jgi:selenoprotein W-related protein
LQELEQEIESLSLVPGKGGMLDVRIDDEVVFSNKSAGRFPEPRDIKDMVRSAAGLAAKARHSRST